MPQDPGEEPSSNPEKPAFPAPPGLRIFRAGSSLGNYEVGECLCSDVLGAYYRARDMTSSKQVGLFIFPDRVLDDPGAEKKLRGLASKLKSVKHPALLQVHSFEIQDGQPLFITEDFEGENLESMLIRHLHGDGEEAPPPDRLERGTLPPMLKKELEDQEEKRDNGTDFGNPPKVHYRLVQNILQQVSEGLIAVHRSRLEHHALNPRYVLRNQDGMIRIVGLGIIQALGKECFEMLASAAILPLDEDEQRPVFTFTQVLAPEIRGGQSAGRRSDIYGIGVIGYLLLTAQRPTHRKVTPPSEIVGPLPDPWNDFLARCLSHQLEERFATASAALSALYRVNRWPDTRYHSPLRRVLDRIPLPGSILDRGLTTALSMRLLLIGLIGAGLVGGTSFTVRLAYDSLTTETLPEIAQVAEEQSDADFVLEITPMRSKVSFTASDTSLLSLEGRIALKVRPGRHRARIEAPNHRTAFLWLDTSEIEKRPKQMTVRLPPIWASLQVDGHPGTRLTAIDHRDRELYLGELDTSGKAIFEEVLYAGKYRLRAEKAGYQSAVTDPLTLGTEEPFITEITLVPLPATVLFTSEPAGAKVLQNGEIRGQTPIELTDITPEETHRFTIQKSGFRLAEETMTLEPGDNVLIDFGNLAPEEGSLQLTLLYGNSPEEARRAQTRIFINDRVYAGTEATIEGVPAGALTIRVEHPDFQPLTRRVTLADRSNQELILDLRPRPAQLQIETTPSVDYRLIHQGRVLPQVASGRHLLDPGIPKQLEIHARNYLVLSRSLTLGPNERVEWSAQLTRIPPPETGEGYTIPYKGLRLSWIPPGVFRMGSPRTEAGRLPEEGPETRISIQQGFWMSQNEVTQAQYQAVMSENPSTARVGPDFPVESLDWEAAKAFAQRLTAQEQQAGRLPKGYVYRLPTEAEWAYAARAGSTTPFHFGTQADGRNGNFQAFYPFTFAEEAQSAKIASTTPVGSYPPNAFGLYDVHGNVAEWMAHYYDSRLPGGDLDRFPIPESGDFVSTRGGSWQSSAKDSRLAARGRALPGIPSAAIGIRLVLAPKLEP